MPTPAFDGGQHFVKCAEIFWDVHRQVMEYQCAACTEWFTSHQNCVFHVKKCTSQRLGDSKEWKAISTSESQSDFLMVCFKSGEFVHTKIG